MRSNRHDFRRPSVGATLTLLAAAMLLPHAAGAAGPEKPSLAEAVEPRLTSIPMSATDLATFDARTGALYSPLPAEDGSSLRGTCPLEVRTHSTANFGGGQFVLQAGLVEGEIVAASYSVSQSDMPVRIDLMEFVIAHQATVQTTTQYTILIWEGTPNNGNVIGQFSSDGVILQPIVIPPGTNGVNLNVSVDPGDPEQIIIRKTDDDGVVLPHCNGTNCTFSVGFRVDEHQNPPTACCSFCLLPAQCCPPPNNSNAFPTTDTANPNDANFRQNNWLFCLPGCTVFGIGCGDGWHRFDQMDPALEPGGDWNIRVSYTSLVCQVGACCDPQNGSCEFLTGADCLAAGGNFQGDNTFCDPSPCPQPVGACCAPNGGCADGYEDAQCTLAGGTFNGIGSDCGSVTCPVGACCAPSGCQNLSPTACATVSGGLFQGNGTICGSVACPEFNQACCFAGDPPTCSDIFPSTCSLFTGEPQGAGSSCAQTDCFPTGACCMPLGTCTDDLSPEDCGAAGGNYRGNNTTCATQTCPQPTGACCVGTNCAEIAQAQCTPIPGASWKGAFTTCPDACLPHGACCLPDGSCAENQTSGECAAAGGTHRGNNSVCAGQNCPQPSGACCNGGSCTEVPQANCAGEWLGAFSTCPGSCATTGACCVNGACSEVAQGDCHGFVCDVADHLPPTFADCYGDADGNGVVNAGDRGFISANINRTEPLLICLYDLDGNGVINAGDRGFVSANIGLCAPLRDFQNGSGLNGGLPDTRFGSATFFGNGSTCGGVTCP